MYLQMFSSAIVLRYKMKNVVRPFRIGKGNGLLWLVAGIGFCGALLAFILSFIPPGQIATGSHTVWFSVLVIGCIVVVVAPFIIYASRKPSWKDPEAAEEFAPFGVQYMQQIGDAPAPAAASGTASAAPGQKKAETPKNTK